MRASGGSRLEWPDIPADVRAAIEAACGGTVVEARNEAGGFSPGLAARVRLADGSRRFVKAVSRDQNEHACRIHRREAEVARALPRSAAVPDLHGVVDDGHWVALVFDEVDGSQPDEPWQHGQLDLVLDAIAEYHRSVTPAPIPGLQTFGDRHGGFDGWRRFVAGDGPVEGLDRRTRASLDELAALETAAPDAGGGTTLLHADLRADNMLLRPDGSVVFVDWPWACIGAAFVDFVFFLPSVGLGGGPDPFEVERRHGLFTGVPDRAVNAVLAAVAGFFVRSSFDDPPPGIPNVRAFQAAQGRLALDWLFARMG